jgi:hypothetical protein
MEHRTQIRMQMEEVRNVYKFVIEGMRSFGRPRSRCLDKINDVDLLSVVSESWAGTSVAVYGPNLGYCQHCSEFPGPVKGLKFLEQLMTVSLSGRALPHEVEW